MAKKILRVIKGTGYGFGTSAVFLTSICTILGAIMFLRFGYAVGNLGLIGALTIIILGHLITIPTGLALSEIATNLKVGGGGAYYIISRSFGTTIGSSIGIMLYASQVISIAFYVIAFAEIFKADFFLTLGDLIGPFVEIFESYSGIPFDTRMVSLPLMLILIILIFKKGANIGIKALWAIFGILLLAVGIFLIGSPFNGGGAKNFADTINNPADFATVFAIIFPAFTGIMAGVGMSGDLKNPRKSIPNGVILAVTVGLIIYILIVLKLFFSAPLDDLANNQIIMYDIAFWGPIILIGLAAATLSSAIGSILVAPRTLQALSNDETFPNEKVNQSLSAGVGKENEPRNALYVSSLIAVCFVILGDLNVVASIITMFFLITYGSICLISFLEHFAGNPSYRPTFRTKWYLSFMGTILCFAMMFQIHLFYALIAISIMLIIYKSQQYAHRGSRSFAVIFQGVMFQLSRWMKLALQKSESRPDKSNWRPSVIAISSHADGRSAPKDLLRWISDYYGFGTMIHYIKGDLNMRSVKNSRRIQHELVEQINVSEAKYSVSTVISPSMKTAVSQAVQFSGISGLDNNTILFEYNRNRQDELEEIVESCRLVEPVRFNICILASTEHNFGFKERIHIWLTKEDYRNGNLMILLSFIIMAHSDWEDSEIKIYTAFTKSKHSERIRNIKHLIQKGRLPITLQSIESFEYTDRESLEKLIYRKSKKADLVILGFTHKELNESGSEVFKRYGKLRETLFVSAGEYIKIS